MLAWRQILERRGYSMSDGSERREARRFNMNLPLRVLSREAKGRELNAQTRDLSYQGLYFLAEADFQVGNEIDFVITLPQQVTQSGEGNMRCQGKIVRVETTENGRMGIAAKIARYEFIPGAATAAGLCRTNRPCPWKSCRKTRFFRTP